MNKPNMKKLIFGISLILCCACGQSANTEILPSGETDSSEKPTTTGIDYALVNTNATENTKQVFNFLKANYGKKILSATVANVDWNTREAENVKQWTGHYPAMNVFDFINFHSSKDVNKQGWIDYSDISVVKDWWKAGGLVGCMWHWNVKANNGTDYTCTPGAKANETSFDVSKLDDPSSAEHKQIDQDLAQIAGYLKKMQKAGVTVIWRPLHEAAGNTYEFEGGKAWFWWGAKGAEPFKKLWRYMYNKFVNEEKLNNLIWVWTSQVEDSTWYPGDDVVDIIGRDNYYCLQYPVAKEFRKLSKLYPNKMITLAECGNGDEVHMSQLKDLWDEGTHFSWFMPWYDYAYNQGQTDEHQFAGRDWWVNALNSGLVIFRDDVKR